MAATDLVRVADAGHGWAAVASQRGKLYLLGARIARDEIQKKKAAEKKAKRELKKKGRLR